MSPLSIVIQRIEVIKLAIPTRSTTSIDVERKEVVRLSIGTRTTTGMKL